MALLTITGYPCSGKTRRVEQLKTYFETRISGDNSGSGQALSLVHLSDDILNVPRSVYDNGRLEKPARQTLFTAVQRALGKGNIVIVDGMNYIKGFRYQMFCAAKEANVRVATVYIATPPDKCKEWHAARIESSAESVYADETYAYVLR